MLNKLTSLVLFILLLSGCTNIQTDPTQNVAENNQLKEEAKWEEVTGKIHFKADNLEEISWDELDVSKSQFDDFLNDMLEKPINLQKIDPKLNLQVEVQKIDFNGEELEITLKDIDEENVIVDYAQGLTIYTLDLFGRYYYLHSEYCQDSQQPTIRFYDEAGNLISENKDYIEIMSNQPESETE